MTIQDDKTGDDDFGDLDFDDLDDESWDDFGGDAAQTPDEVLDTASAAIGGTSEKIKDTAIHTSEALEDGVASTASDSRSFLSKHGKILVFGAVLIGAGGYAATQFLSNSSSLVSAPDLQKQAEALSDTDIANMKEGDVVSLGSDLPPMPTPDGMNTNVENGALNSGALTPLPDLDESAGDLPDLEIALEDSTPLDVLEDTSNIEIDLPDTSGNPAIPEVEFSLDEITEPLTSTDFAEQPEVEFVDDLTPTNDVAEAEENALQYLQELADSSTQTVEDIVEPEIEVEDISTLQIEAADQEIEKLQAAIEDAAEPLVTADVPETPAPTPLEPMLNADEIKPKLAEAGSDPTLVVDDQAMPNQPETPVQETVSPEDAVEDISLQVQLPNVVAAVTPNNAAQEPIEQIKEDVKPKPVVKKIVWTLRSARPGEASISKKGSSDFRRVEVGDRVAGLGAIKSIKIENGKWIVRGSQGLISQ